MNRVIAISHDAGDARAPSDRCTAWLRQAGYRVTTVCPAAGQSIPELDCSVAGVVVFGGKYDVMNWKQHPFLGDEMRFIEQALERRLPYLGICFGGQLLAQVLGEDVDGHRQGFAEYGYYDLAPTPEGRDFISPGLKVLQSHWHGWHATPKDAIHLAATENFPQQAFRYGGNAFGIQFHPEASRQMLQTWIARRPPERYLLKGAYGPERQLADNLAYDAALATWFHGFLGRWIGAAETRMEAAE